MLGFKINTKEAVLCNIPRVKPHVDSSHSEYQDKTAPIKEDIGKSAAESLTCFFDGLDCLAAQDLAVNPASLLITQKIRVQIQQKITEYGVCAHILEKAGKTFESNGALKDKKTVTIGDRVLQQGLKTTLRNNISVFQEFLSSWNEGACDQYIDNFVQYCKEINLTVEWSPLDWLKAAANIVDHIPNYVIYETSRDFLKQMDVSEQQIVKENDLLTGIPAESIAEKTALLFNFLQRKLASDYGFKIDTSWQPTRSFDQFTHCIRTYGYLMVGGFFGAGLHSEPATPKKIGELTVWAWKKGTYKVENAHMAHEIIIVGASKAGYEKSSQDLVYFIDLARDRRENNYPVYIMSYQAFCERLGTAYGHSLSGLKQIGKDAAQFNYLFYHPQLAPKPQAGFWPRPDCKTVTQVALAAGTAAVGVGFALSKTL